MISDKRPVILLVNTGSPDSANTTDVKRYLKAFLSDPNVIPSPMTRWFLAHCIIPFYAKRSSKRYQRFESPSGFPLVHLSQKIADALEKQLNQLGYAVRVQSVMRYGKPSLTECLRVFSNTDTSILLIPLFPQYTQATTGSILKAALDILPADMRILKFHYIRDFSDFLPYIDALAQRIQYHWAQHGRGEKLLLSFHSIPAHWSDGYVHSCETTVRLIAKALELNETDFECVYQSAFQRTGWLQPELNTRLQQLAKSGIRHVDIICPGFIVDNLETLDDIDRQAHALFSAAGGHILSRIPCLNTDPIWIDTLTALVKSYFEPTLQNSRYIR